MKTTRHKILNIRIINASIFAIQLERRKKAFRAGQYVYVYLPELNSGRDYSIYSAENDPFIELVVKVMPSDDFSQYLLQMQTGEFLELGEVNGKMVIPGSLTSEQQYLFVATGTGITPIHSIVMSNPDLNYQILHGVPFGESIFNLADYQRERYTICTSRDSQGDFEGYVTDYLRQNPLSPETLVYLSGNSEMVFEIFHLLLLQGVPRQNIFSEYF